MGTETLCTILYFETMIEYGHNLNTAVILVNFSFNPLDDSTSDLFHVFTLFTYIIRVS